MPNYNYVKFQRRDGRADLLLNRPPRNLLNVEMLEEVVDALNQERNDESLKVLVLRGEGGNFCGGIQTSERTSERIGLLMPLFTRMFDYLSDIRGLTMAAVKGEALEGGCELALFCDVVIAADTTRFGHPEITFGLFPPVAAAVLPRLVGRNRALDWIISGEEFTAQQAHQAGIVSRLVQENRLDEEVNRYAGRVAGLSAPAISLAKRAIDTGLYAPVMEAMRNSESTYMLDLMSNLDPHEGLKAAIEGRPPVWRDM